MICRGGPHDGLDVQGGARQLRLHARYYEAVQREVDVAVYKVEGVVYRFMGMERVAARRPTARTGGLVGLRADKTLSGRIWGDE